MKITKVDHTRFGVEQNTKNTIGNLNSQPHNGMLYKDPTDSKNAKIFNIINHVNNRLKKSKNIYSIFNSAELNFGNDKAKSKLAKDICSKFNKAVLNVVKTYGDNLPDANSLKKDIRSAFSEELQAFEHNNSKKEKEEKKEDKNKNRDNNAYKEENESPKTDEELIRSIVAVRLRKSLSKNKGDFFIADITEKIFCALCLKETSEYWDKITNKEITLFFKTVSDDYNGKLSNKKRRNGAIPDRASELTRSLELKDVKVQPVKMNGKQVFVPSSFYNNKKYVFSFIKRYALSQDVEQRNEELKHIRRLVILYYYGADKYKMSGEYGSRLSAWSWGSLLDLTDFEIHTRDSLGIIPQDTFVPELLNSENPDIKDNIPKLWHVESGTDKNDLSKTDKAVLYRTIKSYIRHSIADHYIKAAEVLEQEAKTSENRQNRPGIDDEQLQEDLCWLRYFEQFTETFLEKPERLYPKKFSSAILADHAFKTWISFVAIKYIDIGKAVFHFAMPDLYALSKGEKVDSAPGVIRPEYIDGLSSFDYEKIKASENLAKAMATHIHFACSIFAYASVTKEMRQTVEQRLKGSKTFEDVLQYNDTELKDGLRNDFRRRILMYFGGQSRWKECEELNIENIDFAKKVIEAANYIRNSSFHYTGSKPKLSDECKTIALVLFNKESSEVGKELRKKYFSNNVPFFYSENTGNTASIDKLMNFLYKESENRESQIPAFERIMSISDVKDFLSKTLNEQVFGKIRNDEVILDKYVHCMRFLFKEIYYHGFLTLPNKEMKKYFENAIEELKKLYSNSRKKNDKKEKFAFNDFCKRVRLISDNQILSLGYICQSLMTEYNLLNPGNHRIIAQKNEKPDDKKYKHYYMLLYQTIREAFKEYLNKNGFRRTVSKGKENNNSDGKENLLAFLLNPNPDSKAYDKPKRDGIYLSLYKDEETRENAEKKFCKNWDTDAYKALNKIFENNDDAFAWYIMAHFLPARHLNFLLGDIKSYVQYIRDIERRKFQIRNKKSNSANSNNNTKLSENTDLKNSIDSMSKAEDKYYKEIISVLDLVRIFADKTTNILEDYFEDEEDYARHIKKYVNYSEIKGEVDAEYTDAERLRQFCMEGIEISTSTSVQNNQQKQGSKEIVPIGLYYDYGHPIMNRSFILALMYGIDDLLEDSFNKNNKNENILTPITMDDLKDYYLKKNSLNEINKKKQYENKNEQKKEDVLKDEQNKIVEFQKLKNRIELYDITRYTEIVEDYLSQLVSYAYMRERDLMYFQLGFHYARLNYGTQEETPIIDTRFRKIAGTIEIENKKKEHNTKGDEKININISDNAILYQICAMYTHDLPVFGFGKDGTEDEKSLKANKCPSEGAGVSTFIKKYCPPHENLKNPVTYNMGLELFEDIGFHDSYAAFRNYIAHMKYLATPNKSILDMYSQIYNGFFSYDIKLRKSVSFNFSNILKRYFVIASTNMSASQKSTKDDNEKDKTKWAAGLTIKDLYSDINTYTLKPKNKNGQEYEKKIKLQVKSDIFLKQLKNILEYKSK